ncbi:uncharacterized protein LOC133196441 [Saccostrea echinata]|uniref:uncharacterized protein LOC133196441 n=1 Tax=Saccostrea echinata TaxID=191078 RepID=UPI002A7EFA9B|nr:uncharacterized protein LOC133196441 [Saccostrea echinata]
MNAVVKVAKEQIRCPVCGDSFTEPKTLSCLHSFCKKCIADHIIKTTKNQSDPAAFSCPVCRKETPMPPGGSQSPSSWADNLQTNTTISKILKAFESESLSKNCTYHPNKEIEFYCEDHFLSICSLCATITHKKCEDVIPIEEAAKRRHADSGKLSSFLLEQSTLAEKLLTDRKGQIEYLERTELDIKSHLTSLRKKVIEILDSFENKVAGELVQKKNKEIEFIKLEVQTCENILEETRNAYESFQDAVQKESPTDFVLTYLKQAEMFQQRQMAIGSFCQNLKNVKIIFTANKVTEQALRQIKSLGKLHVERTANRHALPYAKSYTESRQNLLQTPRSVSSLHRGTTPLRPMSGASTIIGESQSLPGSKRRPISFRPRAYSTLPNTPKLQPIQQRPDTFKQDILPNKEVLTSRIPRDLSQSRPSATNISNNVKLIRAKLKSTFDASTQDQHECSIEGATVLKSGHVVLADSYHSSLKLFDPHYNYLGCIKFSTAPGDVTAIADDEVVVCLPDTMQLKHEKLQNNKLVPGESLAVRDKCNAASYNNGILATCSGSTVHVFKRENARWIRILSQKLDVDNLMYIAVDKEGERIVVTKNGYPNRPVLCLNKNGQKIWSFTHEELRLPRGVAFYKDQILVVSWDQQRILQLSKDGHLVGTVVHDGLQWPWKLCISPMNDKLFVTQCYYRLTLKEKNSIKVFLLK